MPNRFNSLPRGVISKNANGDLNKFKKNGWCKFKLAETEPRTRKTFDNPKNMAKNDKFCFQTKDILLSKIPKATKTPKRSPTGICCVTFFNESSDLKKILAKN